MSEFFENNQELNEQNLTDETVSEETTGNDIPEESTVFSAPAEHNDKAPKNPLKKKIITIIAACLAVAILVGSTLFIIDWIPEITDGEAPQEVLPDISLLDRDSTAFTAVDITNTKGSFKFTTKQITSTNDDGETQTKTYWCVDNIDISKLSSDSVNEIITNAASITAKLQVDTKTKEECGLDKPIIKVSVQDSKDGDFGFSVGEQSPDGLGYYFALDGEDKIYVVPANELSTFEFESIDLTDKTSIPATIFDTDTSSNKLADGSYGYFDSLTISGELFKETITIENNKDDNSTVEIVPYIITTPRKMYAQKENVPSALTLFSKTINVAGNYAIDINDETLKNFGLDKPDAIVTLTINGEAKTFKFSKIDDEYCAVIYDGATMIRKVTNDSFEFLTYKPEDFYYTQPLMNSMNDISSLELVAGEDRVKFDISYTEDSEGVKTFSAKVNGTDMKITDFQNFYQNFVDIRCNSFDVVTPTVDVAGTVTIQFHKGYSKTVKFYAVSAIEYQIEIDGDPIGKITSASYSKMVRMFKEQANAVKAE